MLELITVVVTGFSCRRENFVVLFPYLYMIRGMLAFVSLYDLDLKILVVQIERGSR